MAVTTVVCVRRAGRCRSGERGPGTLRTDASRSTGQRWWKAHPAWPPPKSPLQRFTSTATPLRFGCPTPKRGDCNRSEKISVQLESLLDTNRSLSRDKTRSVTYDDCESFGNNTKQEKKQKIPNDFVQRYF